MPYITIGNASQDERGSISGGSAGDQTGGEVCFRTFKQYASDSGDYKVFSTYKIDKGWNVIRPKDSNDAVKIVKAMCLACRNNDIGYDQNERRTLYENVKNKGFNPSQTTKKVECDCSSLTAVCLAYAGIKIDPDSYTGNIKDNMMATGKFILNPDNIEFKAGQGINWNINKLKPGDVLVTRTKGHVMIVVSNTTKAPEDDIVPPSPGPKDDEDDSNKPNPLYEFTKYSLTDAQLIQIARLCKQEQGSIDGARAEASLAANRYEHYAGGYFKNTYSTIYGYMRNSGEFYRASYYMDNGSYTQEYVEAVRDVLVKGHRTLPLFVDVHDSWGDIRSVTTDGRSVPEGYQYKDQYIRDKTKIFAANDSWMSGKRGGNAWSVTYSFWTFPAKNSDPFGYESEDKRKRFADSIDTADYYAGGGQGGGGDVSPVEPDKQKVILDPSKLRPYVLIIDRNTTTNYNYLDLKFNKGVSGVLIEAGYLYDSDGSKVEKFRSPKCYNQVEAVKSSNLPWGFTMRSTARTAAKSRLEIEELAYIVRKYPPYLGVWIDVNAVNSKSTNDTIITEYEKSLERLGLKNMIGLRVNVLSSKKFTWTKFQNAWFICVTAPVSNTSELNELLTPEFFDLDGR